LTEKYRSATISVSCDIVKHQHRLKEKKNMVRRPTGRRVPRNLDDVLRMLVQQKLQELRRRKARIDIQNIRHAILMNLIYNNSAQSQQEDTNSQIWIRIFRQKMGALAGRTADMGSEHLHGNTIIYKRNLTADFECSNRNCRKRWDSTQVNVEFHYWAEKKRLGENVVSLKGTISIYEDNGQQCTFCQREFVKPIYVEGSMVAAAETIKNKIVEKFYRGDYEQPVFEEFSRNARKSAHVEKCCEGCLEGVCVRNSVLSEHARPAPTTNSQPTLDRPVSINWGLEIEGLRSDL